MNLGDLDHVIALAERAVEVLERISTELERIAVVLEDNNNMERDSRGYSRRKE